MTKKENVSWIKFILYHRSLFSILAFFIVLFSYSLILKYAIKNQYDTAYALMESGDYSEALIRFQQLGDYKDSAESLGVAQNYVDYDSAKKLFEDGEYKEAAQAFAQLEGFQDSANLALEAEYLYAMELFKAGMYEDAASEFGALEKCNYKDSKLYSAKIALALYEDKQKTVYDEAYRLYKNKEYYLALENFENLGNYLDSQELAEKCKIYIQRTALSTTISAGIRYSVAITTDNKAISTGYNAEGQSNVSEWEDIVSVSAKGCYTVGLKSDGTVVVSPDILNLDPSEWSDIVAVSAGERYFIGLKSNGTLVSYGHDAGDGQRRVDGWENITAIATGWRHTVGLDKDRKVHITGYGSKSQLNQISSDADNWVDIIAVAAGGGSNTNPGKGHTVALRADGKVFAVGDNEYGQCEVSDWEDVIAIAAGDWHTVGLCKDGTVLSTRPPEKFSDLYTGACDVKEWKNKKIVAIAAGCGTTIGLTKDGKIVAAGFDEFNQTSIANEWTSILNLKSSPDSELEN